MTFVGSAARTDLLAIIYGHKDRSAQRTLVRPKDQGRHWRTPGFSAENDRQEPRRETQSLRRSRFRISRTGPLPDIPGGDDRGRPDFASPREPVAPNRMPQSSVVSETERGVLSVATSWPP